MPSHTAGSLRSIIIRSDNHPALVPESGDVLTYAGLQQALDRAAGRLAALGVRDGDRVAIAAANGPGLIVAFLAVVASGAVAAPLNPALSEGELTGELADLRVSRLLHDGVASAVAAAGRSGVAASLFGSR
jgi:acyl-coenzyme A synthetase/AMP-(fatty) acid ligase